MTPSFRILPLQALALEKVMERPTSRRIGAKPVLRGEDKFPCLTLHHPPSLQPSQKFTGGAALEQLSATLEEAGLERKSPAAAAAAMAVAAASAGDKQPPAAAAASVANGSTPGTPGTPGTPATPTAAAAAAAAAAPPPAAAAVGSGPAASKYVVLKRGAVQAKEILTGAQATGSAVVVVWTEPENEASEALAWAAEEAAKMSSGGWGGVAAACLRSSITCQSSLAMLRVPERGGCSSVPLEHTRDQHAARQSPHLADFPAFPLCWPGSGRL